MTRTMFLAGIPLAALAFFQGRASAAGSCDPGSFEAAKASCNSSPPKEDCGAIFNGLMDACHLEVEQNQAAVENATPDKKAQAVENLRETQRKLWYDMGGFKDMGLYTAGADVSHEGESFLDFAKEAWHDSNAVIEGVGYSPTPAGRDTPSPPPPVETGGDEPGDPRRPGSRGGKDEGGAQHPSKEAVEGLLGKGKASEAERMLDGLLKDDPENPELLAMRSVSRLNQDKKSGALQDAISALEGDPNNKTAQEVKDFIELTGRAAGTDIKLKGPTWESKDMGSRFDGGGEGEASGHGRLMSGAGRNRGPGQAGGGGYDAVDPGGAGWHASGRGPGAGAYAPSAQGTLPLSQGLTASQVLVHSAHKKLRLGDVSGAFLEATRALQTDAGNAGAWTTRAAVSNKLKNHDAAIADATEALKLEPRNVPALLERGYAQYNMGNLAAALEDVGSAIKIEPMNALAYLYRGMIFEKMTRYSEALSDYEAAARLDPTLRQFWEDAKARLLGGKAKSGGGSAKARRRFLWTIPSGLALLILVLFIRRRLRERAQAASEAESGQETEPGAGQGESAAEQGGSAAGQGIEPGPGNNES